MLTLFLKLIAAATAAAIAEALLPDGGAKGGIAGGSHCLIDGYAHSPGSRTASTLPGPHSLSVSMQCE